MEKLRRNSLNDSLKCLSCRLFREGKGLLKTCGKVVGKYSGKGGKKYVDSIFLLLHPNVFCTWVDWNYDFLVLSQTTGSSGKMRRGLGLMMNA